MKKLIALILFLLVLFSINALAQAQTEDQKVFFPIAPKAALPEIKVGGSVFFGIGMCDPDSEGICDCTKYFCNGFQAVTFLMNDARNQFVDDYATYSSFGINPTKNFTPFYVFGKMPLSEISTLDNFGHFTVQNFDLYPFSEWQKQHPTMFDVLPQNTDKSPDAFHTFRESIAAGRYKFIVTERTTKTDYLEMGINRYGVDEGKKGITVFYMNLLGQIGKNYISGEYQFDNQWNDAPLIVIDEKPYFDSQTGKNRLAVNIFMDRCKFSLKNYIKDPELQRQYCLSVFTLEQKRSIKRLLDSKIEENFGNISSTVTGSPSTVIVSGQTVPVVIVIGAGEAALLKNYPQNIIITNYATQQTVDAGISFTAFNGSEENAFIMNLAPGEYKWKINAVEGQMNAYVYPEIIYVGADGKVFTYKP